MLLESLAIAGLCSPILAKAGELERASMVSWISIEILHRNIPEDILSAAYLHNIIKIKTNLLYLKLQITNR